MNAGKLLPPYANLIFDEAHNLEDVATNALADTLSPLSLYTLCQKLAPSKGREIGSLFHHIQKDYIEASLKNPAERAKELQRLSDIRAKGVDLAKMGKALFTLLDHTMMTTPEKAVRYRSTPDKTLPPMADGQPQCRREICLTKSHFVPAEPLLSERDLRLAQDNLRKAITAITSHLDQLEVSIKLATPPDAPHHPHEELISSIGVMREDLLAFSQSMDRLLASADNNAVYWMEVHSEKERTVSLQSAPLDIASQLHQLLYKNKASIIFSSATLRIRKSFEHIQHTLGLHFVDPPTRVASFLAESPFDYPRQCCVAVPSYLPDVNSKGHAYELDLSRLMYSLFVAAKGRSLALFTSYEMMQFCADTLAPHLEKKGIDLLVQSANMSRDAMTEAFREQSRPTVIFGTQSFWEGVDVVGDALSCVVIARLPFDVASSPLNAARGDRLQQNHRSAFNDLALPNALIKFRQGFGRLIRSRSDKGMVVIADTRITQKSYGYAFAQALPCRIEAFNDRPSIERRLKRLLQS
jgi:Rad3-related DNA helicase